MVSGALGKKSLMEREGRMNRIAFKEAQHIKSEALNNVYQAFIQT
jgi:hypothetical protein